VALHILKQAMHDFFSPCRGALCLRERIRGSRHRRFQAFRLRPIVPELSLRGAEFLMYYYIDMLV
jgi:hypothetical protein